MKNSKKPYFSVLFNKGWNKFKKFDAEMLGEDSGKTWKTLSTVDKYNWFSIQKKKSRSRSADSIYQKSFKLLIENVKGFQLKAAG